ncbi:Hypothetical predicted protein [Paramuricea clavata]|uniref:Uncharacterized protein n=1 Tax=Paramuricea clavata TaxID=317549 RepID=A0A6S7IZ36_PARCT|nr:Hypothetical predicted protein [Paramuricea clavata]
MERYLVLVLLTLFFSELATPALGCESKSDCDDGLSTTAIVVIAILVPIGFVCIVLFSIYMCCYYDGPDENSGSGGGRGHWGGHSGGGDCGGGGNCGGGGGDGGGC